jgi:hypothetical protein
MSSNMRPPRRMLSSHCSPALRHVLQCPSRAFRLKKRKMHRGRRRASKLRYRRQISEITRQMTSKEFQRAYRLTKPAFKKVLGLVQGDLRRDSLHAQRSSGGVIDLATRLATQRFLAGGSYHDIFPMFKIGTSTMFSIGHSTAS